MAFYGDSAEYVDMDGHVHSYPGYLTQDEIVRLRSLLRTISNTAATTTTTTTNATTTNTTASVAKDLEDDAATAATSTQQQDKDDNDVMAVLAAISTDSDYPHFTQSTHAWAVFADDPRKSATWQDRLVGLVIIAFQLYTYSVFATEAVEDYQRGQVPVMIRHQACQAADYAPENNFECEAEYTNNRDAFVAFFMLGIFLSGDMIQAIRVLWDAGSAMGKCFAALAFFEVVGAFLSACMAVSYNLYIGEVSDAIEVGVGLLFIRELSSKTYAGIRNGKRRQYHEYISCLVVLILIGMAMDPLCERWFAVKA